ncbi:hypothetical protein P691DRAFT_805958 [Macrolepiota fuliginosa MF-IS2]|uniref:Uncharacterized protein n=1 Tax=Macrolepiota fuliginosa MF-IS2 TaxID=1400762 RepID=A0A9P5X671_9AGAR|nr:hypothetical protein P691DRAFT_805958 [Macrolepiota fuliginosa MF-IS2]
MYSAVTLVVLLAALPSAYAQFFVRRRPTIGRVIAGIIVGGLVFIFLIIIWLYMLRRRRRARSTATAPQQSTYGMGWSGGPYYGQHGMAPPPGGPGVNHVGVHGPPHGLDRHPMYPPPYDNNGKPWSNQSNRFNYSSPDAPPPALTKGDNHFVGGFKP